jgi:hypothetical protein
MGNVRVFRAGAVVAWLCLAPSLTHAKWLEVTAGGIRIISQASEAKTLGVANDIEAYGAAVTKLMPRADVKPRVPVTMFLLGDSLWNQYAHQPPTTAGFIFSTEGSADILVQMSNWLGAAHIVRHELTHLLLHQNLSASGLPVWFNEGYAELLSTIEIKGGEIRFGVVPVWRWVDLRKFEWMPLETVLNVSHASPEYRKERLALPFYAQSWLMMHHGLIGHPERGKQIERLRAAVAAGEAPRDAFRIAFPEDEAEYERELRAYGRNERFKYWKTSLSSARTVKRSELREIKESEALDELVRWMLQIRPHALDERDMKLLKELADGAPASSVASVQLAFAHVARGETSLGQPMLDAGCALPIDSARLAMLCGRGHQRQIYLLRKQADDGGAAASPDTLRALAERARGFYELVLQLEPGNLEGLLGAARTYGLAPGDTSAIRTGLEAALGRHRTRPEIPLLLARLFRPVDLLKARNYMELAVLNADSLEDENAFLRELNEIAAQLAVSQARRSEAAPGGQ